MKAMLFRLSLLMLWLTGPAAAAQAWYWALAPATNTLSYTRTERVRLDSLGNTYVLGRCDAPATVGGVRLPQSCYYVAQLNFLGQVQWVQPLDWSNPTLLATDLATDRAGHCYVTGTFLDAITLGPTHLQTLGQHSAFVAALDAGGQWRWAAAAAGGGLQNAVVAVSPQGRDVWVGGMYRDSVRCGPVVLPGVGSLRLQFMARLDAATGGWAGVGRVPTGGPGIISLAALTAAEPAQVYLTGNFIGSVTFGSATLDCTASNNGRCGFIAKFSGATGWKWARSWGTAYNSDGTSVAIQPTSGNVIVAGSFGGPIRLDTTRLNVPANYPTAGLIACVDNTTGQWRWANKTGFQGQGGPTIRVMAMDDAATIYIGSAVPSNLSPIVFGSDTVLSRAAFIASADSRTGQWQHAWTTTGPGTAVVTALAANAPGEVVIGGEVGTPAPQFGPFTIPTNPTPAGTAYVAKLLDPNPPTGLPPVVAPGAWTLWPNPASHRATLRLAAPARQAQALEVRDALGRLCARTRVPAGQTETALDLTGLPAGLYVVRGGRWAQRLVVAP